MTNSFPQVRTTARSGPGLSALSAKGMTLAFRRAKVVCFASTMPLAQAATVWSRDSSVSGRRDSPMITRHTPGANRQDGVSHHEASPVTALPTAAAVFSVLSASRR
jgi:hypothetical protein